LDEVPPALLETAEAKTLRDFADCKVYNIVQLIYRSKHYEGNSKDYEFSRLSMNDHWRSGYEDAQRALAHKAIFERPDLETGFRSFDFLDEVTVERGVMR
jgi:NTE family protein